MSDNENHSSDDKKQEELKTLEEDMCGLCESEEELLYMKDYLSSIHSHYDDFFNPKVFLTSNVPNLIRKRKNPKFVARPRTSSSSHQISISEISIQEDDDENGESMKQKITASQEVVPTESQHEQNAENAQEDLKKKEQLQQLEKKKKIEKERLEQAQSESMKLEKSKKLEREKLEREKRIEEIEQDSSLRYLRDLISEQIESGNVSTMKLSSLPKNQITTDIANRAANRLTQQRIAEKLHTINKYIDCDDWISAWNEAREEIHKAQGGDREVQNQLIYSIYGNMLRNLEVPKLEKFMNHHFPSNLKGIEEIISQIKPLVVDEIQGKRPVSLVKETSKSYEIISMVKAIARQSICASILEEILLINDRKCTLSQSYAKSDEMINDNTLLEAYQYLLGTMNDNSRHETIGKFRAWFLSFSN